MFHESDGHGAWVMLLDSTGAVMDFVAAGLDGSGVSAGLDPATDVITFGLNSYPVSSMWNGSTILGFNGSTVILRQGSSDNDNASDWVISSATPTGTTNAGLTLPMSAGGGVTDVSCNGGSDGSATVAASGGTSPYTYLWSDGQSTASANGLSAGTYTATITDANGCISTTTATISEPTVLSGATASTAVTAVIGATKVPPWL